jgi:hypothetical protein
VLESLRPGGSFVIDLISKEQLARIFSPVGLETYPDGTQLLQRREIFDDWTRIRNQWTIIRRGRTKVYAFHHTIYSGQELRDLMERAGFTGVKLYGSLDGEAYGRTTTRLVAVGRKP